MTHPNLHIHAYKGRESGIMIIGTKEELTEFASDLARAVTAEPQNSTSGWPYRVLTVNGTSPFRDDDYPISFHVQTEPIPDSLQKRPRRAPPWWFFLGVAFFTLIGMVSLLAWLVKLL